MLRRSLGTMLQYYRVVLLFLSSCVLVSGQGPRVEVSGGVIEGLLQQHSYGNTMDFLGVPYAAPPVGDLRFMLPQPHAGWEGVLETKAYGAACIQDSRWIRSPYWDPVRQYLPQSFDEDCLTLNIHVPGKDIIKNRTEKLAIMIWIHGGAYFLGNSGIYRGYSMAVKEEIIVITINYRVNVFGFLSTGDDLVPGNMGLMDQVQALKWVQENIGKFGGDKDRVTIFGESAGSWSASLHIVSPKSEGLFQRVIAMSGVETPRNFVKRDYLKEKDSIRDLLNHLGCPDATESKVILDCLQNADVATIRQANYWQQIPIMDGEGGFLPKQPPELWADGNFNTNSFFTGVAKDDGDVVVRLLPEVKLLNFYEGITIENAKDYIHDLKIFFKPSLMSSGFKYEDTQSEKFILDMYIQNAGNKLDNLRDIVDCFTDSVFISPAYKALESILSGSQEAKVYLYYFTHKGSLSPSGYPLDLGPFHTEGMQYLFGIFANDELPMYNASDLLSIAVSNSMIHAWATFAKTGEPKYLDSGGNEHSLPAYDVGDQSYLEIETDAGPGSVKQRLRPRAHTFWNTMLPSLEACHSQTGFETGGAGPTHSAAFTTIYLMVFIMIVLT